MNEELKRCPFCASEKITVIQYDPFDGYHGDCSYYIVQCKGCGLRMDRRRKEEAIEAWNRRAE